MHGSHATGLARADSDLDLLTSLPLEDLVQELRGTRLSTCFSIVEHVHHAQVPRLILHHVTTGLQVDVVTKSADLRASERDHIFHTLLQQGPLVRDLAVRIGDWVQQHGAAMPRRLGFPNSYIFRLTGFHHLMIRPKGRLINALSPLGCNLDPPGVVMPKAFFPTVECLFEEWLMRLAVADTQGMWVNLRNPWEAGVGWCVVDPVSGKNLTQFRGDQPSSIANLARRSLTEIQSSR